jgi:hypothetical protein
MVPDSLIVNMIEYSFQPPFTVFSDALKNSPDPLNLKKRRMAL